MQRDLPKLLAIASGEVFPRQYKKPHYRSIDKGIQDHVRADVVSSAENYEETTTEVVSDMFTGRVWAENHGCWYRED